MVNTYFMIKSLEKMAEIARLIGKDEDIAEYEEKIAYRKGAVQAAKDAENISQDLYKNGLADFNNVLDAQRSLLALEESLTISRGKISQDLVKLYKSLGGGISM
jgi:outer membrane protein TolC